MAHEAQVRYSNLVDLKLRSAAFIVTSDVGGSAGAAATFAVDVKGIGKPVVFDYSTIAAEAAAASQKAVKA